MIKPLGGGMNPWCRTILRADHTTTHPRGVVIWARRD